MRVLALDSAFGALSVAAADGAAVAASAAGDSDARAAESLPALLSCVLDDAGWRITDVDRFAVTLGPGGFTSLRAGLAFAKGLAMGAGKPLLGFTTLEALAVCVPAGDTPIATVIDAKREEVFLQVFGPDHAPLSAPAAVSLDRLARAFDWPVELRICGSGADLLLDRITGRITIIPVTTPDAAALARHCQTFDPAERPAEAVYLRPADARPMA